MPHDKSCSWCISSRKNDVIVYLPSLHKVDLFGLTFDIKFRRNIRVIFNNTCLRPRSSSSSSFRSRPLRVRHENKFRKTRLSFSNIHIKLLPHRLHISCNYFNNEYILLKIKVTNEFKEFYFQN